MKLSPSHIHVNSLTLCFLQAWLYNGAPPLVIALGAYSGGLIVNHLIMNSNKTVWQVTNHLISSLPLLLSEYDVTTLRKIGCCVCLSFPGLCLIVIGLFGRGDSNYPFTLVVFLLSSYLYGFTPSAISVNCMDLAPAYTGSLYGVANTVGSIPGVSVCAWKYILVCIMCIAH